MGGVLSRSDLDAFLYLWYHAIRTQSGFIPVRLSKNNMYVGFYVYIMLLRLKRKKKERRSQIVLHNIMIEQVSTCSQRRFDLYVLLFLIL